MIKLILVIGGTGAQGFAVVQALLNSNPPFAIRVLSRDPENARVKEQFKGLGVELVKGTFMDPKSVEDALQGCYGTYVNTDSFSVNQSDELSAAVLIYEAAARTTALRHFVWSGTDYLLKLGGFNPKYGSHHANAKARFSEFLRSQPSDTSANGLAWTIMNPVAYTDMLQSGLFQPQIAPDHTRVFAYPLSTKAQIPLITIADIGAFARAVFADRETWSGKTLNPGSCYATGPEIAEKFTRVTGLPATGDMGRAPLVPGDVGGVSMAENFAMTWPSWEDGVFVQRDFEALNKMIGGVESLEAWMRRTKYTGEQKLFMKSFLDRMDQAQAVKEGQ